MLTQLLSCFFHIRSIADTKPRTRAKANGKTRTPHMFVLPTLKPKFAENKAPHMRSRDCALQCAYPEVKTQPTTQDKLQTCSYAPGLSHLAKIKARHMASLNHAPKCAFSKIETLRPAWRTPQRTKITDYQRQSHLAVLHGRVRCRAPSWRKDASK